MIDIGGGAHGLRDPALLDSALARPQNLRAYGEEDTFQLAASYAEAISRNHPFMDGNKRTAFATADIFLAENGYHLDRAKGHEHAALLEKLGQGQITREDAAEHLREHSRPLDRDRAQTEDRALQDDAVARLRESCEARERGERTRSDASREQDRDR